MTELPSADDSFLNPYETLLQERDFAIVYRDELRHEFRHDASDEIVLVS